MSLAVLCNKERIHRLSTVLLSWFAEHRRALPWREEYTPYATWIAEVMMQQTQMERGVAYFTRWMQRFPSIADVAEAEYDTILHYWEGLGYYRRARYIKAAADIIMTRYNGQFPTTYKEILALPGIGAYTAGAIASTAFNHAVPCIDGNAERVLSRIFDIDVDVKTEPGKSQVRNLATALIPEGQARDCNQAIMEFGALVCRKKPLCTDCPLSQKHNQLCQSHYLGIVTERPVRRLKKPAEMIVVATGILLHNGKIFIQRREPEGVWGDLWEFPGGCVEQGETPEQAVVREWQEEVEFHVVPIEKLMTIRHGYTTYKITLHCYLLRFVTEQPPEPTPKILREATDYRWIKPENINAFPLPAPHRTLADAIFNT